MEEINGLTVSECFPLQRIQTAAENRQQLLPGCCLSQIVCTLFTECP